ncbi:MAG: hypothetical protein WBZ36_22355, partial [Candidatus Nitrosopolaris sp.]
MMSTTTISLTKHRQPSNEGLVQTSLLMNIECTPSGGNSEDVNEGVETPSTKETECESNHEDVQKSGLYP